MKCTAMLLSVLGLVLLAALPAAATGGPAKILGTPEFSALFQKIVGKHTSFPPRNLEIANFTAEPPTLTVPDGRLGYRLLNQVHGAHLGRKTLLVAILVHGKEYGPIRMDGDLRLYGEVACAAKSMDGNHLLSATDIHTVRRDVTFLGPGVVTDAAAAVGKLLTVSVQPGTVLYTRYLKKPPLVKRGDLVTILARAGGLEVKASGRARDPGAKGDLIRVKNLMSRQIVEARVEKPGLVEVDF